MGAIGLDVADVVDEIDGGRHRTECYHRHQRMFPRCEVSQTAGGKKRHEDENVFHPLIGPEGLQQRTPLPTPRAHRRCTLVTAHRHPPQMPARVHDNYARSIAPNSMIGCVVAGVDKSFVAETRAQCLRFAGSAQIDCAVRRHHIVEQRQMIGDSLCHARIRRRHQNEPAARGFLRAQQRHELFVVGKQCRVEIPAFSQFVFQGRSSAPEPTEQAAQIAPVGKHRRDGRFMQRIGVDQRAIEIHAERQRVRQEVFGKDRHHVSGGEIETYVGPICNNRKV